MTEDHKKTGFEVKFVVNVADYHMGQRVWVNPDSDLRLLALVEAGYAIRTARIEHVETAPLADGGIVNQAYQTLQYAEGEEFLVPKQRPRRSKKVMNGAEGDGMNDGTSEPQSN